MVYEEVSSGFVRHHAVRLLLGIGGLRWQLLQFCRVQQRCKHQRFCQRYERERERFQLGCCSGDVCG